MTQEVGLGTYLKKKLKSFFSRPNPSSRSDGAEWTRETEKPKANSRPRPAPFSRYSNSTTIKINGRTYNLATGDILTVNGKTLKPGTPEYTKFKKEMEEQEKYWAEFSDSMSKMARDMGTSAADAASSIRDIFK